MEIVYRFLPSFGDTLPLNIMAQVENNIKTGFLKSYLQALWEEVHQSDTSIFINLPENWGFTIANGIHFAANHVPGQLHSNTSIETKTEANMVERKIWALISIAKRKKFIDARFISTRNLMKFMNNHN